MIFNSEILKPVISSIERYGERYAFFINEKYYTYKEFGDSISNVRMALSLQTNHNKNVGLVINDDLETYASIFALWLEGNSYVPLHPSWPIERCVEIINEVGMDVILDSSNQTRYSSFHVINTKLLKHEQPFLTLDSSLDDESLAYILFTSGSTGKPKGVQITRGNVASFMNSFWKTGIIIDESDRCLQCFDLSFDVSVQSYLVPLVKGACCFTIPMGQIKYIYASSLIEDHKLTFGAIAPSMLRYLKPYFNELDASSLKTCILTAEACPVDLIEEWFNVASNTEIYDFYGPTECTIYCTYYKLNRSVANKSLNGITSIGRPMEGVNTIIVDENGNEVPVGIKGELCIAGNQVTKGYFNNEEKNHLSFFIKQIDGVLYRFYHTGDLCFKDSDGDIMYSGRLDHQTKIQGFRVEMGEIEYHAREFLKGANVVCLPYSNKQGLSEIAMFIENEQMNTDGLVNYLKNKMPSYMIPSKIIFQAAFELNNNGKIDKNRLKKLITI